MKIKDVYSLYIDDVNDRNVNNRNINNDIVMHNLLCLFNDIVYKCLFGNYKSSNN